MAYLTVTEFKKRTVMPDEDVDVLETRYPGYLDAKLEAVTSWINAKLFKRYAVPFLAPVPVAILEWAGVIVTPDAYLRRGVDPSDAQMQEVFKAADRARAEVQEAADSEEGRYDLPRRQDKEGTSGISRGGVLGYAEASPYTWADRQIEEVRNGR